MAAAGDEDAAGIPWATHEELSVFADSPVVFEKTFQLPEGMAESDSEDATKAKEAADEAEGKQTAANTMIEALQATRAQLLGVGAASPAALQTKLAAAEAELAWWGAQWAVARHTLCVENLKTAVSTVAASKAPDHEDPPVAAACHHLSGAVTGDLSESTARAKERSDDAKVQLDEANQSNDDAKTETAKKKAAAAAAVKAAKAHHEAALAMHAQLEKALTSLARFLPPREYAEKAADVTVLRTQLDAFRASPSVLVVAACTHYLASMDTLQDSLENEVRTTYGPDALTMMEFIYVYHVADFTATAEDGTIVNLSLVKVGSGGSKSDEKNVRQHGLFPSATAILKKHRDGDKLELGPFAKHFGPLGSTRKNLNDILKPFDEKLCTDILPSGCRRHKPAPSGKPIIVVPPTFGAKEARSVLRAMEQEAPLYMRDPEKTNTPAAAAWSRHDFRVACTAVARCAVSAEKKMTMIPGSGSTFDKNYMSLVCALAVNEDHKGQLAAEYAVSSILGCSFKSDYFKVSEGETATGMSEFFVMSPTLLHDVRFKFLELANGTGVGLGEVMTMTTLCDVVEETMQQCTFVKNLLFHQEKQRKLALYLPLRSCGRVLGAPLRLQLRDAVGPAAQKGGDLTAAEVKAAADHAAALADHAAGAAGAAAAAATTATRAAAEAAEAVRVAAAYATAQAPRGLGGPPGGAPGDGGAAAGVLTGHGDGKKKD